MNQRSKAKVDVMYYKCFYIETYSHLLKPMMRAMYSPRIEFPDIFPRKARRMTGRSKKHIRRKQGEDGRTHKESKNRVLMHCYQCLKVGYNKTKCKATLQEMYTK